MKRILTFISVFALLLTACEGDPGPPGPPGFNGLNGQDGVNGLNGQDGVNIVGQAFEIVLDFTPANDYSFVEPYGPNFEIFPSDVTLVYIEWDVDGGEPIWRLLPQTEYFDDGSELVYNFDFTTVDVRFFLDGTADFDTLDPVYTDNQAFRVVVVPADNVDGVDLSNLDNVMQAFNIESFESL